MQEAIINHSGEFKNKGRSIERERVAQENNQLMRKMLMRKDQELPYLKKMLMRKDQLTPQPVSRAVLTVPFAIGITEASWSMYASAPCGNCVPPPGNLNTLPS